MDKMTVQPVLEFVGMPVVLRSECMVRLLDLCRRIAQTSAAVLITGESGTGKEVIARALHQYSLRSANQWVDVNCGSLPESLIESELFGYEKGAFSGAAAAKPGLFEVANKGTVFLDEVGELDPRMQVKLLRVLDGASYYRLGGVRKVSTDARVIAATNRDLSEEIAGGRFRSDLFHRLSQFRVHVPPLRERPEDAIAIAEYFLEQQEGSPRLADDAVRFITGYSWPGNIRELRNAITSAAVLASGPLIHASDLRPVSVNTPVSDLKLEDLERRTIRQALAAASGHQQRAAEWLGISTRTLSRKLKRYESEGLPDLAVLAAG